MKMLKRFALFLLGASSVFAWTKTGTTYTTDGSVSDINSAITDSTTGDRVNIPSGTFTWNTTVFISKAITLAGAGQGVTTINGTATCINAGTVNGWRVTGITRSSTAGYFVTFSTYGLIDHCTINGFGGNDEWIFGQGPSNSWQTANSLGTANAVYVEDCIFNVAGYNDFNANARGVIRFCTINANIKVDSHGLASNTPPRGVRQTEIYNNTWTATGGFATAIEMRGGTGILFDNTCANTEGGYFWLSDYGYLSQIWPNFGAWMTPNNYAIGDQIGTGQDVTINATAITAGMMVRVITIGTTDYTAIGGTNSVGAQFVASGAGTGSGTVSHSPAGAEPMYVINNVKNGSSWARQVDGGHAPTAGAVAAYGSSFSERDIIQKDRDFFATTGFDGTFTFNGTTGCGRGTKAQMNAITPTKTGVGFWVTDEGNWNTTVAANTSGQLYTWNGSAWVLYYTPYTYPYPTTATAPVLSSASVPSAGTSVSFVFDQPVTFGAGGNGGLTLSASGGAVTLTYSSGSTSNTLVYTTSRTIQQSETITTSYTQPGNGIEGVTGTLDLASFSGSSVTNNSTQNTNTNGGSKTGGLATIGGKKT